MTPEEIDKLIEQIYNDEVNLDQLPENVYTMITTKLVDGVYEGLGNIKILDEMTARKVDLSQKLINNVNLFGGAKTFNYVMSTEGLMVQNGKVVPFDEFKDMARQLYDLHNVTWLASEYNTAINQANQANEWDDIEANKEFQPFLKYNTIIDENTSDVCRQLDGIVKRVDDPFWNTFAPSNHYNCRCQLDPLGPRAVPSNVKAKEMKFQPDKTFKLNPGKNKVIFSEKHPYFESIPKNYKGQLIINFGFPKIK